MKHALALAMSLLLIITACSPEVIVTGDIVDSRIDTTPTPLQRVYLQASLQSNTSDPIDVTWTSDIQGLVGKENPLNNYLLPGDHNISLTANSTLIDTTFLQVSDYVFTPGVTLHRPQFLTREEQELPSGEYSYFSVAIPLEGEERFTSEVEVTNESASRYALLKRSSRGGITESETELEEFKDFVHNEVILKTDLLMLEGGEYSPIRAGAVAPKLPDKVLQRTSSTARNIASSRVAPSYQLGDQKPYLLWTGSDGYTTINSKLYYKGEYIQVWVDTSSYTGEPAGNSAINEMIDWAEKVVLPRQINDIVGPHFDLDGSGNFSIVMSKKINDEKLAIGFFNPSDFFDKSQTGSNEEDIIYLGFPDINDHNFTPKSLASTIGHEYAHLVYFSNKTYRPLVEGKTSTLKLEETFLNEGLAHLTESLFGFGESGGNLVFTKVYFIWPERFSLSSKNTVGRSEDSPERRGAVMSLLWWLFVQEGGAKWDEKTGSITDLGGIAFLSRLTTSPYIGWENIVKSSNKYRNVTEILTSWAGEYLQYNSIVQKDPFAVVTPIVTHPITDEIVTISPFVKEFTYNNITRPLNRIITANVGDVHDTYAYTVVWGDSFVVDGNTEIRIPTESQGNMTYGFPMIRETQ